jgi:hypothetical protein
MLEKALTTDVCSQIVSHLLRKRDWTISRIARVIGATSDYVRRVELKQQSFQLTDVQALAKACKLKPHRLVFNSFNRDELSPDNQGLYDMARDEIERNEELSRVLMRKPVRKRRSGTKAA